MLLILIPALPLAAAIATAAFGRGRLREWSHLPTVVALVLSFAASIALLFQVQRQVGQTGEHYRPVAVTLWNWCNVADAMQSPGVGTASSGGSGFRIDITLQADPLTAVMLAIVTCVAALVAVYSIGYMHGDRGCWRFFAYVGLFVFSMTTLVSAANFLLLYVGWELVGLCSYLLIGFWYEKPAAAAAGKKAFLVNRIGDVGFALGVFLIWTTFGTLDFDRVFAAAGTLAGDWRATAICLLLLAGACGKSAQFPLHVWLPDAMEGPTPVSALIHAATMVTAGVYMLARCTPLFAVSADAQCAVAAIGGITALLGGVIAVTQTDLKRILAYSTISHLGYMFVAVGVGTLAGVTAGMFHLVTHAFFKALLFLGAGSVMHATGGVIDIRELGGLRRRLPVTYWTFLVGSLSIAGLAPLAGFWSKDAILLALSGKAHGAEGGFYGLLLLSTLVGVLLIDFYMFRPFFLVFHGPERLPRQARRHAHESPGTMTAPLVILAFAAATAGAYLEWNEGFARFLHATPSLQCLAHGSGEGAGQVDNLHHEGDERWRMGVLSTAITLFGIAAAAVVYLGSREKAKRLAAAMDIFGLYSLSYGKFFFDPIYSLLIVRPLAGVARLAAWFDQHVIDTLVDFCGRLPSMLGAALRPVQNGAVPLYALVMALGLLAILGVLLM
jgi:NADH-quinone oxidoreductase subunit L